jgi:hypothetical protein
VAKPTEQQRARTPSLASRALGALGLGLDRLVGWPRLPTPLGLLALLGIRARLRERNLYDTGSPAGPEPAGDGDQTVRTIDGTFNDLEQPRMGSIGARFGRNIPLHRTYPEAGKALLTPSPRTVSRELLRRDEFIPATTLNLLAAAWIQFEVHDWFSHRNDEENPWELPLEDDDPWPERPMRIPRTRRDPSSEEGFPPTYGSFDTHWWDGSQIYGSEARFATAVRAHDDGKLRLDEHGMLPEDLERDVDPTGPAVAWWLGLSLLHTLFTLEHNAICDRLRNEHPTWTDDQLYARARLINAALMAKIHTVEWTPAIIAHPTTVRGMRGNWWGIVGESARRSLGRIGRGEVLSGIPGSSTDHHGVPYSLTEEFVSVYRMHPLIPDEFTFRSAATDEVLARHPFPELRLYQARKRQRDLTTANALYSFGIANPGAITLHNYPRFLQDFDRPDGLTLDLAAVDILRIRERGVPRYNEFRRLFDRRPVRSFAELTDNPRWAEEIRRVYDGDLDNVDLLVGLYAEPVPRGFGFSDTAFRVFVLMASRRLKSDRFFTRDYTPAVYTQTGLDWISDNTMHSVLRRHFPQLEPALRGVENAFAPWRRVK